MSNHYRNNCKIIAISGFSGAGKDTVAKDIAKLFDLNIVVSYTTRPRRQMKKKELSTSLYLITNFVQN